MPRLLLHIGDHKTGTSSIQQTLAALDDPTILYPETGRAAGFGHQNLAWEIGEDPRFDPDKGDWATLGAEIACSDAETVVVSTEALEFKQADRALAHIRARLRGTIDAIEVALYLRPHAARIRSSFAERLKRGHGPFETRAYLDWAINSGRFHYAPRLKAWARAAGAKALKVRPFHHTRLKGGDVVTDFFAAHLNRSCPISRVAANPSPSAPALRMLQIYGAALTKAGGRHLSKRRSSAVAQMAHSAFGPDQPRADWSLLEAEDIAEAFANDARHTDAAISSDGLFSAALAETVERARSLGPQPPVLSAETEAAIAAAAALYARDAARADGRSAETRSAAA
ncbi:MAG: hypothetical protein AAF401_12695 [Pseudomonadota bacterium]